MKSHCFAGLLVLLSGSFGLAAETQRWKESVARLTQAIEASPTTVDLYSQRGDVRFFLADFAAAASDYDKMVELDSELLHPNSGDTDHRFRPEADGFYRPGPAGSTVFGHFTPSH